MVAFGLYMLYSGWRMRADEAEAEWEEALEEVERSDAARRRKRRNEPVISTTLVQTFGLCLLGEWGDRSQLATIIIAARYSFCKTLLTCNINH
jgi:putative Ca2+/H+ antiporter (TMEM165/GDT1 family)